MAYRVALTGGIASGKSTVAAAFAALGVPVIDTDVIAREVVEPGQPALARLVEALGAAVLDADGRLDRRRLRERIFSDPAARRVLEGVLHPAIRAEMERQSLAADGPYQLLVIPLLAEGGSRAHVDRVLVVDVAETTQVHRLQRRDGATGEQAEAALRAQASREQRLAIADEVIDNEGDPAGLERRVRELHALYLSLATTATAAAARA